MAILDTTFLIGLEGEGRVAVGLAQELRRKQQVFRVPAIAWVEYLAGIGPGGRRAAQESLETTAVFEAFDRECAAHAVRIQAEALAAGRRLAWSDLQVAATAARFDEPIVSNDDVFDGIPGLERIGF